MIQLTRQKAIERLADDWADRFSDWNHYNIIVDGIKGLNMYTNSELEQCLNDIGDDDEYRVEGPDEITSNNNSSLREGIYLN